MIDEKKLIEELEEWKARCGITPAEEAAEVMIAVFIDKVKAFAKRKKSDEPEWKASMMRHFVKVE